MAASIGGKRIRHGSSASGRVSKSALGSAHMSVDGRGSVGQGSSAKISMKMNCAQKFVNTKLVEEI